MTFRRRAVPRRKCLRGAVCQRPEIKPQQARGAGLLVPFSPCHAAIYVQASFLTSTCSFLLLSSRLDAQVAEAVTEHLLPLMRVTRQIFGGAKL